MLESDKAGRRDFLSKAAISSAITMYAAAHNSETTAAESTIEMTPSLDNLVTCLGGPWPQPCPLKPTFRETVDGDGYRIESVAYEVEPGDRVPAMLLVPNNARAETRVPAIAVWHQHAGQYHVGKSEPAGLAGDTMHHTGAALAREVYVVLCPDALCFEERQDPDNKLKGKSYERFEFLRYVVNGTCMAWKNILDMRRAIDYLVSRPEVDSARIGCYGHSMGSTHTWLVGPHDPRIKALVGNCCLPTYDAIHDTKILHCFPNFVPGWRQFGDTPEIAALIAPRALHLNLGEGDEGTPIDHARAGIKRIRAAYAAAGAEQNFSAFVQSDTGHVLSAEMWDKTKKFFRRHLG